MMIADPHICIPWRWGKGMRELKKALQFAQSLPDLDMIVLLGDTTQNGWRIQRRGIQKLLHSYARNIKIIPLLGNHDIYSHHAKQPLLAQLNEYRRACFQKPLPMVYAMYHCKQTPMVCLGSEQMLKTEAYISPRQCAWLQYQLQLEKDAPFTLLFHHQPLLDTHVGSDQLGIGKQDKEIKQILRKYPQAVWISAHLHHDGTQAKLLHNDYGYQLDIPSFHMCQDGSKGWVSLLEIEGKSLSVSHKNILQNDEDDVKQTMVI